jgi:hypothetical protein
VIFQPNILSYLFGVGIGTNLGASIVWGGIALIAGYTFARVKVLPAWRAHTRSVTAIHDRLDHHERMLTAIHEQGKTRDA